MVLLSHHQIALIFLKQQDDLGNVIQPSLAPQLTHLKHPWPLAISSLVVRARKLALTAMLEQVRLLPSEITIDSRQLVIIPI